MQTAGRSYFDGEEGYIVSTDLIMSWSCEIVPQALHTNPWPQVHIYVSCTDLFIVIHIEQDVNERKLQIELCNKQNLYMS